MFDFEDICIVLYVSIEYSGRFNTLLNEEAVSNENLIIIGLWCGLIIEPNLLRLGCDNIPHDIFLKVTTVL